MQTFFFITKNNCKHALKEGKRKKKDQACQCKVWQNEEKTKQRMSIKTKVEVRMFIRDQLEKYTKIGELHWKTLTTINQLGLHRKNWKLFTYSFIFWMATFINQKLSSKRGI